MTIREKLIKELRKNNKTVILPTSGTELRTRCPYCGDSRKNATSAHMYISMNPPFMYHCFRCDSSGVLNASVLEDFKIHDSTLQVDILTANKNHRPIKGNKTYKPKELKYKIKNFMAAAQNLAYFNNRFNTNYTLKDRDIIKKYKIILDPLAFFEENKINTLPPNFDYAQAIGFVSRDGTFAIFRSINPNEKKRYINVPLYKEESNSKLYTIGTDVDVLKPKSHIILAEGIFDIIGVYETFYKNKTEDDDNYIFVAACGKSYRSAIDTIVKLGFLDFDITIYSDQDVNIDFYKDLKFNSIYFKQQIITIYYNTASKDFGDVTKGTSVRKVML